MCGLRHHHFIHAAAIDSDTRHIRCYARLLQGGAAAVGAYPNTNRGSHAASQNSAARNIVMPL
jgi:hypothetical protein